MKDSKTSLPDSNQALSGDRQKKAVLINDLSGLGRCSLSVELPVLSVMQIECLLMPTAVLSNHTGYEKYVLEDLSHQMDPWMDLWKQYDVEPDAVISGFLAGSNQVKHVLRFLDLFRKDHTLVIIDPVLGDDGKAYPGVSADLEEAMLELCRQADVILPNLTELCLLNRTPWSPPFSRFQIEEMALNLQRQGAKSIVVSGIEEEHRILELVVESEKKPVWIENTKNAGRRAGTGDLFCAVVSGALLQGKTLIEAVRQGGDFVRAALTETERLRVPLQEGTAFERILCTLCPGCSRP